MLPVAISLVRSGFRPETVALIGWFGPRGLASVVFTLLAFGALEPAGLPADVIVEIATITVLFSVIAHGLTAVPLARLYAHRMASVPASAEELVEVTETHVRRRGIG
jgi:NhaP-type Na+/H+ or K+/H+ antiporter